jgi:C-terminal processing protease CtpA/Prc
MFTGSNQLFGRKTIGYTYTNKGNRISSRLSVQNGSFYYDKYRQASVFNRCKPKKDLRIVVLTSQIIASAGAILAAAFKGIATLALHRAL